jgi:hypothetical protein
VDCTNLLLSYGADPNKQDKKGRRFAEQLKWSFNDRSPWFAILREQKKDDGKNNNSENSTGF